MPLPRDPRSDETRDKLLAAGLQLFGRHGYDGVTTRMLAAAARVNQSAIPYHFGGKEGVYRAVAEHIGAEMGPRIQALAAEAEAQLQNPAADVAELLVQVVRGLAAAAFVPGHQLAWFIFLTREQFHPTPAFDILYASFTLPGHALVARLLARLTGSAPEAGETILLAHALIGSLVAFGSARATLQRRLGWSESDYTPAHLAAMLDTIERHCRATVAGLSGPT
ncbi:MAG TPA: CerR family C-terminal domain-containing protein [Azospira sp.]|nr:CerR family C-terminal domain-containing protein [Azospira sp.]